MCDRCEQLKIENPELHAKAEAEKFKLSTLLLVSKYTGWGAFTLGVIAAALYFTLSYDVSGMLIYALSLMCVALCLKVWFLERMLRHGQEAVEGLMKLVIQGGIAKVLGVEFPFGEKPKQEEEKIN